MDFQYLKTWGLVWLEAVVAVPTLFAGWIFNTSHPGG